MTRSWVGIFVFMPSVAFAQMPTGWPLPPDSTIRSFYDSDCEHFSPPPAVTAGMKGFTVLSVHVTADGTIEKPVVAVSSGNIDLDDAALACVTGAHIHPITSGGVAMEVDTQLRVDGRQSTFSGAPRPRFPKPCRTPYPPIAMLEDHQGAATVSFTVTETGTVRNVSIVKSTGYGELDRASISCASQYLFWPSTQDGRPVAVDRIETLYWLLR